VVSQIDRAVSKGVFHRRTGSRYIARLASQVAKLGAA
jgi:ribosomal protein S20